MSGFFSPRPEREVDASAPSTCRDWQRPGAAYGPPRVWVVRHVSEPRLMDQVNVLLARPDVFIAAISPAIGAGVSLAITIIYQETT